MSIRDGGRARSRAGRVDHRVERALDELLDAAELAPALKARVKAEQARKAGLQAEIARLDSLRLRRSTSTVSGPT